MYLALLTTALSIIKAGVPFIYRPGFIKPKRSMSLIGG